MKKIVFDIETAPIITDYEDYKKASDQDKLLFDYFLEGELKNKEVKNTSNITSLLNSLMDKEDDDNSVFRSKKLINACYSRIVGIGLYDEQKYNYLCCSKISEEDMLRYLMNEHVFNNKCLLIGHNVLGFDIPFIVRRCIFYDITIPKNSCFNIANAKPWVLTERIFDTMLFWMLTSKSDFISLDLLCKFLGVKTPKGDFCGSKVLDAVKEGNYSDIGDYCLQDVRATYECYQRLSKYGSQ